MKACKSTYIGLDGEENDVRVVINKHWLIIEFIEYEHIILRQLSEEIILNISSIYIRYKEGDRIIRVVDNSGKEYIFNYSTEFASFLCGGVR